MFGPHHDNRHAGVPQKYVHLLQSLKIPSKAISIDANAHPCSISLLLHCAQKVYETRFGIEDIRKSS